MSKKIVKENVENKKSETKDTNKSKNKKKIIIISIIIILVILLVFSGIAIYYYETENDKISAISVTQEKTLKDFSEEVKYGQEVSYDELVSKLIDTSQLQENTKITIQINDKELLEEETFKFEELGTYSVKIKLEYTYNYSIIQSATKNIENEKIIEIVVEDKEKPVINGVANKEITVGDEINLKDGITATDNVDGEIEVKIDGTVDNTKAGSYDIKVTATDKSGNIEETTFTVTVKEKPKVATNTSSNGAKKNSGNSNKGGNNNSSGATSSGTTGSGTTGAGTTGSTPSKSSGDHIADILRLTNQYRSEVGVSPLTIDSKLASAAQKRATELVSKFDHTRPNGSSCITVFNEYGITATDYGENIAAGQWSGVLAAQGWRNSPGHYANMISARFKKIGIGAYYSGGTWYWVQLFTN